MWKPTDWARSSNARAADNARSASTAMSSRLLEHAEVELFLADRYARARTDQPLPAPRGGGPATRPGCPTAAPRRPRSRQGADSLLRVSQPASTSTRRVLIAE